MSVQKKQINNKAKVRRTKIINAARELFFKKGYKGTTVAEIAKMADYSKRSVYLDFKNKDDLFITICLEGLQILREALEKVEAENLTYSEYLRKAIAALVNFSRENREYFRMNYKEASPEILNNCDETIRQAAAVLEQAVMNEAVNFVKVGIKEKAIPPMDPYEAAVIFSAASSGVLLMAITGNQTLIREDDIEKLVNTTVASIKDGLQYQADRYYRSQD